ncbi:MAG TPA: hypothetical protein VHB78_09210 [Vicinamibacterales bacterium]|jgi:hypothetical protein|nr:hypothetical protein [Vicinamibacterales bacterium]
MSLASDSQLIAFVDIGHLLAAQRDVATRFPEAHSLEPVEVVAAFRRAFLGASEKFVSLVQRVDPVDFGDDDLAAIERSTRIVANLVESEMLASNNASDCQPLTNVYRALQEALYGIAEGVHVDPNKRPTIEQRYEELNAELEALRGR